MNLLKRVCLQCKPSCKLLQKLCLLACLAIVIRHYQPQNRTLIPEEDVISPSVRHRTLKSVSGSSSNNNTNNSSSSKWTKRLPDVVIAGVKKAGTGTLRTFLSHHSMIKIAPREVHFFDNETRFARGYKWYVRQMPYAKKNHLVMEKTPKYFITPRAVDELSKLNVSIIILLRDPVGRVLSDYENYKALRNITNVTIEELILDKDGNISPDSKIIYPSLYAKHLSQWLPHFPLGEKLLILDGDNFQKNPWEELEKAEDFLGLNRELTKVKFVHSVDKGFFCFQQDELRKVKCMAKDKGRQHDQQTEDVIQALTDFFRPHNKQLFEVLGRTFQWRS